MPEESQTLPSEREAEIPMELVEGASAIVLPPPPPEEEKQSTSRNTKSPHSVPVPVDDVQLAARLLNFSVQYKENMVPLEVPDSETVGECIEVEFDGYKFIILVLIFRGGFCYQKLEYYVKVFVYFNPFRRKTLKFLKYNEKA
ncbi:hypothetical protein AVEN_205631-1 [Araneus ventricosus]|uniref:Uncharacterized protein n=1 Tax=Araneus ventricosus TaxID=182803 RepID=A0A4Y2VSJ2_ARAVE|nr:hypothetical protein AVEN_205631-1 [Araneus ventricosus]